MMEIELVKDQRPKEPVVIEVKKLKEEARRNGVLVGSGGVKQCTVRLQPPLVISSEHLHKVLAVLDEALRKIEVGI